MPFTDLSFHSHAVRSGELCYQQVLQQRLRVMDGIAISQCMEQGMLILVFNYRRDGSLERVGSSRPLSSARVWQMKTAAVVLIALFVAPVAFAAGPPLDTFEARRDWILDTVTRDPEAWIKANRQEDNPFFVASACFARGMDDKGRELARRGFAIWSARNPAWDPSDPDNRANLRCPDFFRLWPAMDCYVRNKEKLDDRTKEDFRRFMTSIDCYAYRWTANLDMMKWTARYLGEQEWGVDAFVPSSTASSPRYRPDPNIRYREQLLAQIDDIARTGGPEYASRDYGHHTLLWLSVPVLDRAGYQRISHPHGFNLDAQTTFQHEGTILYVVDTEPGGRKVEYPYGLGYVPGGSLAVVDESRETGRVFFHYPGVLIAIASTKPFVWDRQAPIRMPNSSGSLPPGDSEFRIDGPTFAATIETTPLGVPGREPRSRRAAARRRCHRRHAGLGE